MSRVSFARPGAANQPVRTEVMDATVVEPLSGAAVESTTTINAPVTVPATPTNTTVVPYTTEQAPPPMFSDSDENIPIENLIFPKINIAQSLGDLGLTFEPGTLVLGQQLAIYGPAPRTLPAGYVAPAPVNIVVLGFRSDRYTEKLPDGGMGDMFNTEKEVYDAGGTTDYNDKKANPGKRFFRVLSTALILVQAPVGISDPSAFPYVADGKNYAVALWNLQGAGHTAAARPLQTWRKNPHYQDDPQDRKTGSYSNRFVELSVAFKKFQGTHSAFVPVVKLGGKTPPGVRAIAAEFLGR